VIRKNRGSFQPPRPEGVRQSCTCSNAYHPLSDPDLNVFSSELSREARMVLAQNRPVLANASGAQQGPTPRGLA
jgi:hypothetical protein